MSDFYIDKEYIFEIQFNVYFPFADEVVFYSTFYLKEGHTPFMEIDSEVAKKFEGLILHSGFEEGNYRTVRIYFREKPSEEMISILTKRAREYAKSRDREIACFTLIERTEEWTVIT